MTDTAVGVQSLMPEHATSPHQITPPAFSQQMEHLALMVPEATHLLPRNLIEYALAYIERYQGDVLQLERDWEFLTQILAEAWQQRKYEVVVRLVAALALPAGRRQKLAEGEYVLRLGIVASRRIQDRQHLAAFLNRLGSLMVARGKYLSGQRVWQSGLHLAFSAGSPSLLWQPLVSFAPCADVLSNAGEAQRFVETFQAFHDPYSLAIALFSRGLYARFIYDLDTAYANLSACLRLLLQQSPDGSRSPSQQLFNTVVQAELARAQGDYPHSQIYTATALALAELFSDRYTVAELLIDQGHFIYQQGQFADLYRVYLHLRELVSCTEAPHIAERCRFFEYHLLASGYLPAETRTLSLTSANTTRLYEALSAREREVLRLVADGLSNQAIATELVITPGTVKKHLEHIYTRLDVHSRTAAVACARALQLIS